MTFVDDPGALPHNVKRARAPSQSAPGGTRHSLPPDLPFATILVAARGGDKTALSALYRRFLPAVYRFILARVSGVALAEDLTSDTFMAMLEGIGTVRAQDELGFATWLLRIARNEVGQYYRRQRARPDLVPTLPERHEPAAVADEDDPLTVLTARESWGEVVTALDQLTQEQRFVVLYRCVHGYSTEDVGRALGKPANAIRGLQFRALASLARALGAQRDDQARPMQGGRQGHAPRG
jgi:RNA polymerase sigma-70 factor, ECF subfamily